MAIGNTDLSVVYACPPDEILHYSADLVKAVPLFEINVKCHNTFQN